jgi:hypothetical protein
MQFYGFGAARRQGASEARWQQWCEGNSSSLEGRLAVAFADRLVQLAELQLGASNVQLRQVIEPLMRQARRELPLVSTQEVENAVAALGECWHYGNSLRSWYNQNGPVVVIYEFQLKGRVGQEQWLSAMRWAGYGTMQPLARDYATRVAAAIEVELARWGGQLSLNDIAGAVMQAALDACRCDAPREVHVRQVDIDTAVQILDEVWAYGSALRRWYDRQR